MVRDKTVVITGGNAGLGYECAREVAASGGEWHVILAVRSIEKGEQAARKISQETGNLGVEAVQMDLASLESVRFFAKRLASREDLPPLRAVVCNAGLQVVGGTSYTEDGFETTFGVNHLGHFLLVNLLLKHLITPARVVFVSSGTHDPKQRTGMPAPRYRGAEALAYPERLSALEERHEGPGKIGRRRYTTSKLCNILCAYELDRRLREEDPHSSGVRIAVNAFDPGAMPNTGLTRGYGPLARFLWNKGTALLAPVMGRLGVAFSTPEKSGRALARLVDGNEFEGVSGRYFQIGREIRSSEESYDREKATELWKTSTFLTQLLPRETLPGLTDVPRTRRA